MEGLSAAAVADRHHSMQPVDPPELIHACMNNSLESRKPTLMPAHRMHLKGPWEIEIPAGSNPVAIPRRVKLPASWQELFGDFRGSLRFCRRFHKPTNLDEHERVWLVFDGLGGLGRIHVNDHALGTIGPAIPTGEFDITQLLQFTNCLHVDVEFIEPAASASPGGLWAPVALEIRGSPTS